MLISYQWLKNYIDCLEPLETIASRLTQTGTDVAKIQALGKDINRVIVAELLAVEKHPQADRLSLTKVTDGKETFQVVCGAKNIAPGQKVPLAKVGAVLPGNFEIKAAKIRGIESFGMLCSAKELGIAEDAEGILILPQDAPLGADFTQYMGFPDFLLELEITPNRPDLLSHLGVARELGAIFHRKIKPPPIKKLPENNIKSAKLASVTIQAPDLCRQYACRIINGIQVGPSPRWLSQALEKLGQRSINNIVDVTNYVMMEMGQPMHAFDLDQLRGSQIIVRKATEGEKIPLLDNTEKTLSQDMLVIADAERPVALAGVMGGSNSQVTGNTRNILLESAYFIPGSVRKTARKLGLSTDSSYRFERGVDPQGILPALNRAAELVLKVGGGTLAKGVLSPTVKLIQTPKIQFRPKRCDQILGVQTPAKTQIQLLKDLGCRLKGANTAKSFQVFPPSSRVDLTREIDLIEEIARLQGYNRIISTPPRIPANLSNIDQTPCQDKQIRFLFQQAGLNEAVNSSFLPEEFAAKLGLPETHPLCQFQKVQNPIAEDQKVLRPSLLPSLLANAQLNFSRQQEQVGLYEINKVFRLEGGAHVQERIFAAAILAGLSDLPAWFQTGRPADFHDIKGLAENVLSLCRAEGVQWVFGALSSPYWTPESFEVNGPDGKSILCGGLLSPKVLKTFDLPLSTLALEIDLTNLSQLPSPPPKYVPLPKYPGAWRDIALVVPDGVTSGQVTEAIRGLRIAGLNTVSLFDLYRGTGVAPGRRSLAYRLYFRDEERTLTDLEMTEKVGQIVASLKERFSIELR